ncbi:mucin-binding protein, partial [Lactobacillus hominis]|uniref:mucin-binding protein n=3 Tax=Lactobacillus hominis TaxID=1203033 RepID=UPI003F65C8C6
VMSTVNVKFTENGKEVGALTPIGLYPGQKISIDNLKNQIGEFLKEKGYAIDGDLNLPTNDIVAGETKKDQVFEIKVKPATQTIKPDDLSNEEAIKQDLRRIKTRTIQIQKPNQEVTTKTQTVTFERNKIVQGNDTTHSDWKCVSGDNRWDKFNVDPVDGYQSYVDGKLNNVIEEKDVNVDSKDETVYVSYLDEKYADIKISYQTGDGKTVKDLDKIDLHKDQVFPKDVLESIIKKNIPDGYEITGVKDLDDVVADTANKSVNIIAIIKKSKKVITPNDVADPEKEGLVKRITRTINITLPNGETKQKIQTVSYQRNRIEEDGKVSYTGWELTGPDKGWAKYNIDQISGYQSYVDGKLDNVVEEKDVNCDAKDEVVNVTYITEKYADIKISYETSDGKVVKTLDKIDLRKGEIYSASRLSEIISKNLPKDYQIIEVDGLKDIIAEKENQSFNITVTIKKPAQVITPEDVEDPEKGDFIKKITRTIDITLPNGKKQTETQSVTYTRNKIIDEGKESWTHWVLADGSAKGWSKFNVEQFNGYASYVDGKLDNVVEEKDVNCDDKDETVYVKYSQVNSIDIKVNIKDKDGKLADKQLDKIDLKGSQKLTLAELNEKIKDQIPKGYHITQVTGMPEKDILASDYPNNASLDITITIEADEKYAYDYEDGDLIKRWIRHIYVVKPNEERKLSEIQKVTYVRKKVHKNNVNPASALSARANTNEWEYSDWELHKTEGNSGKWSSYKVEKIDKHKAVVKYPKFLDDPEDREIEADEIEERAVPVSALENDEDEIREVEVNYVPVKDEAPVDPDTPDTPVIPDNPDNDKPSNPDDSSSDTQDPVKPENPGQDDNNSSSSDSSVNNPTDSDNNSSNTSGSEKSTSSFLNPNPSLNVRPLGESPQSTNVTTNNEKLPQSGAGATLSTEVAGLISIAASTVIGAIGYVIGRKKKK